MSGAADKVAGCGLGLAGGATGHPARVRVPGPLAPSTVSILRLLGLSLALTAASGCARVKPYEREFLARPAMVNDRDPGQMRFSQHQNGSREGADGGSGEPGGGCGCN